MTYRDPEPVNFVAAVVEGERARRDAESEVQRATDELTAALRKVSQALGLWTFGWFQFVPHSVGDLWPRLSWPRRKLRPEIAEELYEAVSMRRCPYYQHGGKCTIGCYEEPACIVNTPEGGWSLRGPVYRARKVEP